MSDDLVADENGSIIGWTDPEDFKGKVYEVLDKNVYVPPTWNKPIDNASDALEASACLLEEEGRWRKGQWFEHNNPAMDEYKDDPYCNGWGSCAEGALMLVTGGMIKYCYTPEYADFMGFDKDRRENWDVAFNNHHKELVPLRDQRMQAIYDEAYQYLLDEVNRVANAKYGIPDWIDEDDPDDVAAYLTRDGTYKYYDVVYSFNDDNGITRDDVVTAFREAAKAARGEPKAPVVVGDDAKDA